MRKYPLDKVAKIIKALAIAIVIVFLASPNTAYARGGCFGGDTPILTREGSTPISQLHPGDRILGYNFTTTRIEDEQIGSVQVIQSPDYYLINNKIEVTKNHPFYIQAATEIKLVEVKDLKIGDRLLSKSDDRLSIQAITSIDRIKKPITVYNLLAVTPNHNFYADGILVHNKGGHGGHSGGGSSGRGYTWTNWNKPPYRTDNVHVFYSLILVSVVFLVSIISAVMYKEIYNFIRFYGKDFSGNSELVAFTSIINPNYNNYYSVRYTKDSEIWQLKTAMTEVSELEYYSIVSKIELIHLFTQLFIQYQADWTNKNFEAMIDYTEPEFYDKQAIVFKNDFGNNFDIVYNPEILLAIPINYEHSPSQDIFQIQVDARMINFEISTEGYVLSGESEPRSFTEYWMLSMDEDRKLLLMDIQQV